MAGIIAKSVSNWSFSIVLDKGSRAGIKANMPVISQEGVAGKVVEAGPSVSKAILLTDPDLKIAAAVLRTREEGIVVGMGQGYCKMLYLSRDSDVAVGDMVVTAGYSGIFPKNLLIGTVTDIRIEPRHLYKYAVIKPAVNVFKLEEVMCLE